MNTAPSDFECSYAQFESYPRNVIYKTSYGGVLKAYEARLETKEPPFLTQDLSEVEVHFRDWDDQKKAFSDSKVTSEDELKSQLGDHSSVDPLTGKTIGNITAKRDSKCRFIFLYAELSTKPLKITPRLLKRLFTFHQVMPVFIDFLSVFAHPPQTRELGFSGFNDQTILSSKAAGSTTGSTAQQTAIHQTQQIANTRQHIVSSSNIPRGPAVSTLGRSGRQYQLCYNLKRVSRTKGTARDEVSKQRWSVQQNEYHHQFDVQEGTQLWMNAKGRLTDYRNQVLELTGGQTGQPDDLSFVNKEDCFRSSLTIHLMNCHWATDDWRGYLNYLEEAIEDLTRSIVVGPWLTDEFTPELLQSVQRYEEKITNASMITEANIECLISLRTFYANLKENKDFPLRDPCSEAITLFVQQINDMINAFKGQKRRAKLLGEVTENRKVLLLQKLQGRATKKMEDLTTMSYRETVVMKIITVGTFVFLPATFVSTFFSTDVIKYQGSDDANGSYSGVALERWIEVTVPLTILTCVIGLLAFYYADKRRRKRMPTSFDEKLNA